MKIPSFLTLLALLSVMFLPACGGGGGDILTPVLSPPTVTTQPAAQTVDDGATAYFSVVATGATPLSYQWRKNGASIGGATAALVSVAAPYSDNGALFSVVVSNTDGSVTSSNAALTVTPQAPTINTQPLSVSVQAGSPATFSVVVSGGTGPVTYQWRKNGADIAAATAASYTIAATALVDNAAAITVAVISPSGTQLSSVATLTVTSTPQPPAITAQPQNQTVALGQTATFSVTASSGSPVTYQWSRNGVAIAGATGASYTTAATVVADDGARFAVVATNAAGPTNSTPATLTISNLPSVTVSQVSAGFFHSVVLKSDGSVWSWGETGNGLRGVGSEPVTVLPTRAKNSDGTPFNGVVQVSAGHSHTVTVKGDGTVWGWGYNAGGLGDGTAALRASPVQAKDAAGIALTSAVQVSAGQDHTLVLKADGSVWAWGYNSYGKLGDGTGVGGRLNPVAVLDPGGGGFTGVAKVAAGSAHSMALKTDGTVWAWGLNNYGQLGDGTAVNVGRPVRVDISPGVGLTGVVAIAAGNSLSAAVKSDGTALTWGYNGFGGLGDGTTTSRSRPTLVKDGAGNPLSGVVAVAAGFYYTMFLKSDGTVWATGYNNLGQLGDNTTAATQLNPSVVKDAAGTTFGGVNQVALTTYHTVVRRADGTVWAWGNNAYTQLGDTTNVQRRNPVQVPVSGP